MPTTQPPPALMEELLTTTKSSIRTVPSTISTLPTTKAKVFTSPIPSSTSSPASKSMKSTNITLSTTEKTEKMTTVPIFFNTKSTSLQSNNNDSRTTLTPLWAETNVTKVNYTYNRTEAPIEGTSVNLIDKHVRLPQMEIPITTKSQDIYFLLNSTLSSTNPTTTNIPLISTMRNSKTVTMQTTMSSSFNMSTVSTKNGILLLNSSISATPTNPSVFLVKTSPISIHTSSPRILPTSSKPSTTASSTILSINNFTTISNVSSQSPTTFFTVTTRPLFFNTSIATSRKIYPTIISTTITPTTTTTTSTLVTSQSTYVTPTMLTNIIPVSIPTSRAILSNTRTSTSKLTVVTDKEVVEKDVTMEYTRKPEIINKIHSTTAKFKPKEIWIRPTQKGESIESKFQNMYDLHAKHKIVTNQNEGISEKTTPKTIIVSIIPTSVSHATFKKIALTTASYVYQKKNVTFKQPGKTDQGFTKSMTLQASTAIPFTIKILPTLKAKSLDTPKSTTQLSQETTRMLTPTKKKAFSHTTVPEKSISTLLNVTIPASRTTNSMSTLNEVRKLNSSILTTKPPTNKNKLKTYELTTVSNKKLNSPLLKDETFNKTVKVNVTRSKAKLQETAIKILNEKTNTKNISKVYNKVTTQEPEDETFHILTEPEHITAVMSDKDKDHTSMDLISVISIAGGVMMTVITVAIVIVMIERCKRPRYEDVRKMNDIRMQVMIDNSEVPPPYVRSIFHAPLPGNLS